MTKNKLVVIGGSDAGISASLRAKELSPDTEVTLILADRYRADRIGAARRPGFQRFCRGANRI